MSTCIILINLQKRCVRFDVSKISGIESVVARALDILTSDGAQLKMETEREKDVLLTKKSLGKATLRGSKLVIKTGSMFIPGF